MSTACSQQWRAKFGSPLLCVCRELWQTHLAKIRAIADTIHCRAVAIHLAGCTGKRARAAGDAKQLRELPIARNMKRAALFEDDVTHQPTEACVQGTICGEEHYAGRGCV